MADQDIDERIAFAVMDIETTGLNAHADVPLEVGVALIDVNGFILESESWLVLQENNHYNQAIARGMKDEFVGPMHHASGLWDDINRLIAGGDELPPSEVDEWIVEWMGDMGAPKNLGLMGNSVGSLDRPFILRWFPKINEFIGYRNIDMSSIKELVKRTNADLWEAIQPLVGDKSLATHRVLGDIDACIEEYRVYLREYLITGDEVD